MKSATATRKRFLEVVKSYGATVDEKSDRAIRVDLPAGKCWTASGCHTLVLSGPYADAWKRGEMYAALIDDMQKGVWECSDPNCDICLDENEGK